MKNKKEEPWTEEENQRFYDRFIKDTEKMKLIKPMEITQEQQDRFNKKMKEALAQLK